jgi:hypothetical protein
VNNDETYMQLKNLQQQVGEWVEVYYEHLLQLANCLLVRATYVFLTNVFKVGLLPYLILTIRSMKRDTLMKHKEAVVVCEESGPVNLSYNVLLTTLETNIGVKHVIHVVTTKPSIQPIIVNEMVELAINQHVVEKINTES